MRALLWVALAACSETGDVHHLPDAPPAPDAAAACAPAVGPGTMHGGSVNAPETWTAAGSPYLLPFDTSITSTLTIEPCAVVQLAAGRTIDIRATGSIVAHGEPGRVVRFERRDPQAAWATIRAGSGGTLSLEHAELDGGGDPLNTLPVLAGAIDVSGAGPAISGALHAVDVTLSGSASNGIVLHDGGGFDPASQDLRITGAAGYPIHTFARLAGTIPPGTYTGNAIDRLLIRGTGGPEAIVDSMTLHARGVPYHVGIQPNAVLDVAGTAVPILTIEPGVTLEFDANAEMRIDPASSTQAARGGLVAVGTAAQPIVFTSANHVAGAWLGLYLGGVANPATRIQHASVEYAGGATQSGSDSCVYPGQVGPNDAAIRISGGDPVTQFITDTTILASARHGIDRGFRSDTKPDFLPTNTFVQIAGCKQSFPRDVTGACASPIPCP